MWNEVCYYSSILVCKSWFLFISPFPDLFYILSLSKHIFINELCSRIDHHIQRVQDLTQCLHHQDIWETYVVVNKKQSCNCHILLLWAWRGRKFISQLLKYLLNWDFADKKVCSRKLQCTLTFFKYNSTNPKRGKRLTKLSYHPLQMLSALCFESRNQKQKVFLKS